MIGILIPAGLTPLAFRNSRWIRPIFYFCAVAFGIMNGCGHIVETIIGRTVSTVTFARRSGVLFFAVLADCELVGFGAVAANEECLAPRGVVRCKVPAHA
jgi:hypothetical protein